jgi:glycosyltransferase involved in cell wall biosynthesis
MSVTLSAVVPVYNEVDNLGPLHAELTEALSAFGRPYEIVYVDDGSTDGSFPILRTLQEQDTHVVVVRFARNFGQTAALAAGFDHASGTVVVTLDADRQNVPADIPALVEKLDEGYDLAVGWRHARRDPWLSRKLPSVVANALIGWITGVRLHDYGCTLKAMHRDVVQGLRLYGEMHRFIPALASDLGARIVEVPVGHRPRVAGRSKYGLSRIIRVVLDLMTVKFLSDYSTRPIQVFGVIGLVSSAVGLLLTGVLGIQRLFFGVPLANRPILWLGILLTLMGMQFVTMGLLGELLIRTYHEAQNKPVYRISEVRRAVRLDAAGDLR